MKSLFDENSKNEIIDRINNLSYRSPAQWGKMNVSQMIFHCQFPLKIALQKEDFKLRKNIFAILFFKKSLYSDKLWRKNLPTHKKLKVVYPKVFENERRNLLKLIDEIFEKRNSSWPSHPIFGEFTIEQWGKLHYKHLDHHLRQFNN
ncbi:DUF1569 domain-containing protein [Aquimarina rhabdastrellae]